MRKRKHIELFAGCGGLALGMESAGFELLMANELSPMAAQTFSYNLLNVDIEKSIESEKVYWLSSSFEKTELKKRLSENPFESFYANIHDINENTDVKGSLIIGDVRQLKSTLQKHPKLLKQLSNCDLLSGGPPCQGFSLAGKRIKDDHKNRLPLTFAEIAGLLRPKVVLLENVKGITAPFKVGEENYYAWIEVSKAFALNGFVPVCMMLNSKFFGVPQNRPRFILYAIREDIFETLALKGNPVIINNSRVFYNEVRSDKEKAELESFSDFRYFDMHNKNDLKYFDGKLLPKPVTIKNFVSVFKALNDLKNVDNEKVLNSISDYSKMLLDVFPIRRSEKKILNHERRKHAADTKLRFRFYQLTQLLNGYSSVLDEFLKSERTLDDIPADKIELIFNKAFKNKRVFNLHGEKIQLKTISDFHSYLTSIPSTKKHSQRALNSKLPAPAQLTIPDDFCHYDPNQPRTLTVREMARIQSFPDWFVFKSKATTGGSNRQYEVPQYTQVGNAVPPLLAYHLGLCISNFLNLADNESR